MVARLIQVGVRVARGGMVVWRMGGIGGGGGGELTRFLGVYQNQLS